ncbi:MAG TPA: hypothetical protein V6C99_11070 [Oculatellaceae cyanobacterium]
MAQVNAAAAPAMGKYSPRNVIHKTANHRGSAASTVDVPEGGKTSFTKTALNRAKDFVSRYKGVAVASAGATALGFVFWDQIKRRWTNIAGDTFQRGESHTP